MTLPVLDDSDPLKTPQSNSDHDLLNAIANFEQTFYDLVETCRARILPNLKASSEDEPKNGIDLSVPVQPQLDCLSPLIYNCDID